MGIDKAIVVSDIVLQQTRDRLEIRLKRGFFKDCHGDLHSRNIFLLPNPQPFDCIEFNDALRSIDILNEVAFLCMDLDSFGRQDLSEIFLHSYNKLLPAIETGDDERLFVYYKLYRANVRAKVNSLRARASCDEVATNQLLAEVERYLQLMSDYLRILSL